MCLTALEGAASLPAARRSRPSHFLHARLAMEALEEMHAAECETLRAEIDRLQCYAATPERSIL